MRKETTTEKAPSKKPSAGGGARRKRAKRRAGAGTRRKAELQAGGVSRKGLRNAVIDETKRNIRQLADSLVSQARNGSIRGAEILLALVENKAGESEDQAAGMDGMSRAERWATEPEYDPNDELDAETGAGATDTVPIGAEPATSENTAGRPERKRSRSEAGNRR